jgi:hypothetical protein
MLCGRYSETDQCAKRILHYPAHSRNCSRQGAKTPSSEERKRSSNKSTSSYPTFASLREIFRDGSVREAHPTKTFVSGAPSNHAFVVKNPFLLGALCVPFDKTQDMLCARYSQTDRCAKRTLRKLSFLPWRLGAFARDIPRLTGARSAPYENSITPPLHLLFTARTVSARSLLFRSRRSNSCR